MPYESSPWKCEPSQPHTSFSALDGQSHVVSYRIPGRQRSHCWLERQLDGDGEGPNYRPAVADHGFSTTGRTIDRKGQDRQGGPPWLKSLAQISRNIPVASLG